MTMEQPNAALSTGCNMSTPQASYARWGYDVRRRRCVPFYGNHCTEGSLNNFESRSECQLVCPPTFPPVIRLPRGREILIERRLRGHVDEGGKYVS